MDALAFLGGKTDVGPLYVLAGDEAFLKRQCLQAIRRRALGPDADEQAVAVHAGERATFAEVFDELETLPFFFPRRVVVVDGADPFVTRYRADLEKKVGQLPATGTLVLDVKTWPTNTRLAKLVDTTATLVCKAPATARVAGWCAEWSKTRYGKQLPAPAAALLVELTGPDMGLLDQELQKLAVYVGERTRIDAADVDRLVGNNREQNTFKIFDAIAAGDVKEALTILHRLFDQGEDPQRILGAFGSQLRKLARAYRLTSQGLTLGTALERLGVPHWAAQGTEQQMRHLGRRRLARLYDSLLQLQLDFRGNSTLALRTQLECFVIRLARKNERPV